mmetsp:Transcript_30090/g.39613  ORF Transcript_30090/g.39613 Transcript_30090/m.39613 type:complete len:636 (+) Transcript_30090:116-2023(+)
MENFQAQLKSSNLTQFTLSNTDDQRRRNNRDFFVKGTLFVLMLILTVTISRSQKRNVPTDSKMSQFTVTEDVGRIKHTTLSIQNPYTLRDGIPGQEYPWLKGKLLAEPFKESTFIFEDPLEDHVYEWKIYLPTQELEAILTGHTASYTFESLEDRKVIFTDYTVSSNDQRNVFDRIVMDIKVRYVRREIRALFESDREELLDTMSVLWKVDQDLGGQLYGPQYRSATEMLKFHLRFAGDASCDHIHDGYGFVTQHSALTLLFEQSLQAVNKRVSLPYWDYTKDVEDVMKNQDGNFLDFINSELFSEKYFGATDTSTYRIKDGRWADLAVPTVNVLVPEEREFMPYNAYGQLRAPWSNNKDPHIVRYGSECGADPAKYYDMPTCENLYKLLTIDDFKKYMEFISYAPHGPIHIQTGGTYGCEEAYDSLLEYMDKDDKMETILDTLKSLSFVFHKGAFRAGYMKCEAPDGSCYCPEEVTLMEDDNARLRFLEMIGFKNFRKFSAEFNKALVSVVCNSGLVEGDNLQASSSFTPEFWPIHGSVERMFQWKRLHNDFASGDESVTWASSSWIPTYCPGHLEDEVVLMGTATIKVQNVDLIPTNKEFLMLLNPKLENGLPYIYDNLKWDYCTELGFDMNL